MGIRVPAIVALANRLRVRLVKIGRTFSRRSSEPQSVCIAGPEYTDGYGYTDAPPPYETKILGMSGLEPPRSLHYVDSKTIHHVK